MFPEKLIRMTTYLAREIKSQSITSSKKYVQYFKDKCVFIQIRELLNINPTCSSENKEKAKEAIYMYIKQVYYILDNKMNNIII